MSGDMEFKLPVITAFPGQVTASHCDPAQIILGIVPLQPHDRGLVAQFQKARNDVAFVRVSVNGFKGCVPKEPL
jgi:hypothetical protein